MGERQIPIEADTLLELRATLVLDPIARLRYLKRVTGTAPKRRRWFRITHPAVLLLVVGCVPYVVSDASARGYPHRRAIVVSAPVGQVWQVEQAAEYETFSNGLRVEDRFAVKNRPRTETAGIVYHTTESLQLPLAANENRALRRVAESLVEFVQRKRAYHFVIDRFGRVFRVVAEPDAANHAGNSIWASGKRVYVNLNDSFLGVAFEAESPRAGEPAAINPAQVRSAAILTEMLRARYHIAAENCVTHAQVSVNPANMRAGYHLDWASGFPFQELGLPDNYRRPLASVYAFGFACDASFRARAGSPLAEGVELAEGILHDTALTEGFPVPAYRQALQKRYRKITDALHGARAPKEISYEAN
jgi:hypothetical protein